MTPTEPLLKARDVAGLLGVEMGTVYDYWERGDLPGFRLGGRRRGPLRFRQSEILERLEDWRGTVRGDNQHAPATQERPGAGTGGISSHAPITLRAVDDR